MTPTKTRKRSVEAGVKAIEKMINGPWKTRPGWGEGHHMHECMDGSSLGRIVAYLGEQGFDIDSTDEEGRQVMFGPEVMVDRNMFFWICSQYLAEVLKAGIEQGRFHIRPMIFMAAMIDGGLMPSYEIAKQMRHYKKPRWVPGALWLGPHDDWTEDRHRGTPWTPR